jgi:hypothetical protein
MLKKKGIKHNVLNAVNHEAEATIIAQAGRYAAVTIATNMAGRGTDILLGGNPEFLARSDMENEWINRAAKLPIQGAGRYEDALRELREKFEDEVRKAEAQYLKQGEVFQQQRSDALKRTTELQREIREASPFRETRLRFEDLSATELIDVLHGGRGISNSYFQCKEALESALLQSFNGNDSEAYDAFEEARQEFTEYLQRWQQTAGERPALSEALDEKRRNYEQRVADFEFEVALAVLSLGEHGNIVTEYKKTYEDFETAELRCEEVRRPYEQAIERAQNDYESKRQEYLHMVENIREQENLR